ncbi:hypothetical protein [Hyunsoonleella ulvae]|uniref:hypothetical protein n=1 Tax=Hyunsoonleella ulvae TaxID=2799948 RepID=UPI00193A7436|nr:hypothetical protein [Hyunsoonleella ulvae]
MKTFKNIFMLLILCLLFFDCKSNNQLFNNQIRNFFDDLNYSDVTILKRDLSNLKTLKGKRHVKDKTGMSIELKWFVIYNDKKEIVRFVLGAQNFESIHEVKVTEEEHWEGIIDCIGELNGEDGDSVSRFDSCISNLMFDLWLDCAFAINEDDREKNCWYRKD